MIRFEWDKNKNEINIKKHGISFSEATSVFYDPDHSDDEERFIIMGISAKANLLTVCHCYRDKDKVIRLISARKATKTEEKDYIELRKGW